MNRGGRDDDADEELVAVVCGCGFGPPHAVAVLTLVALAVGIVAARSHLFGRASRYVQAMSYSATAFFHMIPAITATSMRLPLGAPLVASRLRHICTQMTAEGANDTIKRQAGRRRAA